MTHSNYVCYWFCIDTLTMQYDNCDTPSQSQPADKLLPSSQKEALNIPTDYHTVVDPVFN